MKIDPRRLLALLTLIPLVLMGANPAQNCGCACCKDKATCCCHEENQAGGTAKADDPKRYPLKGVIVDILTDQSALMVKHEEIPGYMMAMTMLFKVDAATLKAAQKGQAITGTLVEATDGFRLEDVKPAGQ